MDDPDYNALCYPPIVHPLSPHLWRGPGGGRSRDLSVCYVQRWRGTRSDPAFANHVWWELMVVTGGTGWLECADQRIELFADRCLLIPAGLARREAATGPLENFWIGMVGHRFAHLDRQRCHLWQVSEMRNEAETLWEHSVLS